MNDSPKVNPDLHEEELLPPKQELDDDDLYDLIGECHYLIAIVLERTLPKGLHSDLAKVYQRLDDAVAWNRIH